MLQMTPFGLYCPAGDFHIDPVRAVDRAVITHGHSDHARRGMRAYLSHRHTEPILRHRLGEHIRTQSVDYGEVIDMHGVRVSLHPAGHVVGSAQVRIEHRGEVWVVSGDYKRQSDPLAEDFEPVPCHTFITESTFGLPIYRWPSVDAVSDALHAWWRSNADAGIVSIVHAYPLGKAQRVLLMLDPDIGPVCTNDAVAATNAVLRGAGHTLPPTRPFDGDGRSLIITSGGVEDAVRTRPHRTAGVSGWNIARAGGFVMSDHVDWPGLMRTIRDTGAERILVTHGFTSQVVRYLREQGWQADELHDVTERGDA